jgi:hypothetical protein
MIRLQAVGQCLWLPHPAARPTRRKRLAVLKGLCPTDQRSDTAILRPYAMMFASGHR